MGGPYGRTGRFEAFVKSAPVIRVDEFHKTYRDCCAVHCLTFEVHFFLSHGFRVIDGTPVPPEVYAELLRSHDDGVAEFLDLARVKPNTLGNTRMLLER